MDADCNNKIEPEYMRSETEKKKEKDHMVAFGVLIGVIILLTISGAVFAFVRKSKRYSRTRTAEIEEDEIEMNEVLLQIPNKKNKRESEVHRIKAEGPSTIHEIDRMSADLRRTKAEHEFRKHSSNV